MTDRHDPQVSVYIIHAACWQTKIKTRIRTEHTSAENNLNIATYISVTKSSVSYWKCSILIVNLWQNYYYQWRWLISLAIQHISKTTDIQTLTQAAWKIYQKLPVDGDSYEVFLQFIKNIAIVPSTNFYHKQNNMSIIIWFLYPSKLGMVWNNYEIMQSDSYIVINDIELGEGSVCSIMSIINGVRHVPQSMTSYTYTNLASTSSTALANSSALIWRFCELWKIN